MKGIVILCGVALLLVTACKDRADITAEIRSHESAEQRMWRWEREAPAAARIACSNYVGFRRLMDGDPYVDTHQDPNPGKWTTTAKIEFINKMGGVEVTNLPMTFGVVMGDIYASADLNRLDAQEAREHIAELNRQSDQEQALLDQAHTAMKAAEAKLEALHVTYGDEHTWTFKAGGKVTGVFDSWQGNDLIVKRGDRKLVLKVELLVEDDQAIARKMAEVQ